MHGTLSSRPAFVNKIEPLGNEAMSNTRESFSSRSGAQFGGRHTSLSRTKKRLFDQDIAQNGAASDVEVE